MYICSTCCVEKNELEFHKNSYSKLGHQTICKECKSEQGKKYREENREKILEQARVYAKNRYHENIEREKERTKKWREENPEKYRESQNKTRRKHYLENKEEVLRKNKAWLKKNPKKEKEYRRNYKKKNKEKIEEYHKEYWAKYPEKYKAHRAVNNALAQGKMKKPDTCSRCTNTENIQGHHEDYNKPLEVIWLCAKCHAKEHID